MDSAAEAADTAREEAYNYQMECLMDEKKLELDHKQCVNYRWAITYALGFCACLLAYIIYTHDFPVGVFVGLIISIPLGILERERIDLENAIRQWYETKQSFIRSQFLFGGSSTNKPPVVAISFAPHPPPSTTTPGGASLV